MRKLGPTYIGRHVDLFLPCADAAALLPLKAPSFLLLCAGAAMLSLLDAVEPPPSYACRFTATSIAAAAVAAAAFNLVNQQTMRPHGM